MLVLGATTSLLDPTAADFLRGHVVAFVAAGGTYELRVRYVQRPWVKGEQHEAAAAPVMIHLLR